jgi:hypothetical protein
MFREDLQGFYTVCWRGGKSDELQAAGARLRSALQRVESLVANVDGRFLLAPEQRCGFVQLLFLVHTAQDELARLTTQSA